MYQIPTDYSALFRDRLLIITGVGRSGTSILGKLIGSMTPVYYLYEPAIMKYMLHPFLKAEHDASRLRAILFEDYFLPLIQGRNLNINKDDDTWTENYTNAQTIGWAQAKLSRRSDALNFIQDTNPLFVIKTNEAQPLFDRFRKIFPGVRFIHIIRNGNDVISSTLVKDWYSDPSRSFMGPIVDWVSDERHILVPWYIDERHILVPWYIKEEDQEKWQFWNNTTRVACVWRTLAGRENFEYITYEMLLNEPQSSCKWVTIYWPHVNQTQITTRHIDAVIKHKPSEYPDVVGDIAEPEKGRFQALMRELGYL